MTESCMLQVYCIFLFFCAACLFGTLISQVNEIVAAQASKSKELDCVLEAYLAVKPRFALTPREWSAALIDSGCIITCILDRYLGCVFLQNREF